MKKGDTARLLVTHLFIFGVVCAKPCFEGGDIELCTQSKASITEDEIYTDMTEQFKKDFVENRKRHKYSFVVNKRGMRGIPEDLMESVFVSDEDTDIVDREDHVTQYLSEFLVNTDSEITSLEAADVAEEEAKDMTGYSGEVDLFFKFLTSLRSEQ